MRYYKTSHRVPKIYNILKVLNVFLTENIIREHLNYRTSPPILKLINQSGYIIQEFGTNIRVFEDRMDQHIKCLIQTSSKTLKIKF